MSTLPASLSRTSTAFTGELLLRNLRRTNIDLLRLQEQISTNKKVNRPSDAPESISKIGSLRWLLNQYNQRTTDLTHAAGVSDVTDQAMTDIAQHLTQAKSITSSQVGVGANAETRAAEATVIQGIIDGLMQIANRSFDNIHLFGGEKAGVAPFTLELGGIRYVGSSFNLLGDVNGPYPLEINSNGAEALGALSARMQSTVDLNPNATAATRLADVAGARLAGVTLGRIAVDVDGAAVEVDLTNADTLGDIVTRVNNAIGSLDATAGGLAVASTGLSLTANAGHTITISEVGGGVTATDLGIRISAASATVAGDDLNPRLTMLTRLDQLGVAVDFTGGLKITNGSVTRVVDLSTATTIEDLVNAVHTANVGVRVEINAAGTSLNMVNEVSGTTLSIGENAGGTTATDLGLRSMAGYTNLSDFNHGRGVRQVDGQADLRISLLDGSNIEVDLDGALTVQDVLDAINTAGGGAVTASLAADGNGMVLTDTTAGAGPFRVTAINGSFAAQDLGILKSAGTGSTIAGDDVATIQSDSVFTHLIQLRDALLANDERGITLAGEALDRDIDRVATVRAQIGVRGQRIQSETDRTAAQKLQAEGLLSDLVDTDLTEAISRFSLLQQQLQANLQSSGMLLQLSLLDFLR